MAAENWSEWAVVQLQECIINGIGPEETAALLAKTEDEVCAKAWQLDLLFPQTFSDSPPIVPHEEIRQGARTFRR